MSTLARPLRWPPVFPLQKGLVGWWTFDDRSGGVLRDRSGKKNHGTLYGPTWVAGKRGSALSFDGINDYVLIADASSLRLTQGMTIICGVNFPDLGAGEEILEKAKSYTTRNYLCAKRATNVFEFNADRGGVSDVFSLIGVKVISANVDYVYAVTYNGVTLNLYVNGLLDKSKAITGDLQVSDAPLRLGKFCDGSLAKTVLKRVYIYNRALNAAEIKRFSESELMLARH